MAGFDTASPQVRIDVRSAAVTITDRQGVMVSANVPDTGPAFDRNGFTVRRQLPDEQHVLGLGGKAGLIDRRGGGFTLWNTDAYVFEAGTEPLYQVGPVCHGCRERPRLRAVAQQ